eukprot:gene1392-1759_t
MPTITHSLSASNSPLTGTHQPHSGSSLNILHHQHHQTPGSTLNTSSSTGNLVGMVSSQPQLPPHTPTTHYPSFPSSQSATNLSSLVSQSAIPQSGTQRSISVSFFELFYIEMIDYIMKSSSDKMQAHKKLDKLGFKVGHKLIERLSLDTPLFSDQLETVKFICKVFWTAVFKKSIDGLKTNHKGVFVLTDTKFQWLTHLSYESNSTSKDCSEYVQFASGLIKGAMSNFGYKCSVTFEIQQIHTCAFTVRVES